MGAFDGRVETRLLVDERLLDALALGDVLQIAVPQHRAVRLADRRGLRLDPYPALARMIVTIAVAPDGHPARQFGDAGAHMRRDRPDARARI